MARPKKEVEIPKCPICGEEMPYEAISCNFEQLSGRAEWHMSFKSRIKMCNKCSHSLLEHLEKWFDKNNKTNIYKKFDR